MRARKTTPMPMERMEASMAALTTSLSKALRQMSPAAVATGAATAAAATSAAARAAFAGTPYVAACRKRCLAARLATTDTKGGAPHQEAVETTICEGSHWFSTSNGMQGA